MILQLRNLDQEAYNKLAMFKIKYGLRTLPKTLKRVLERLEELEAKESDRKR